MSKVTVTSATLNIREQPAATSKAVGEYRQGDVVTALARVEGKYLRDGRFHWLLTDKGWIAETYTQPAYSGPTVVFTPAMHAPGSDWMWQNPDLQAMLRQVNLPIKFLSIGFNGDYWAEFNKPEFHLVRIYWPSDKTKWSPQEVWDYVKAGVLRFYSLGARKFELHNEPNLPQEGLGYSWKNGDEFGRWLAAFATTAVWIGAAATTELLPWALGFVVLLSALHACFPFALRRVQPGYVAGGWSGALCCLGLVVLLVPVLSMDDVGVWMWPVVLLLDLIVLAAAAASGILLALAGAVALTFLTLGAAILRSPAVHVDAQAGTLELWLIAGFASLFCAASVWLLRRADARFAADGIRPPAWTRHLPGLSGATPFALLVMLIFKLGPPNPGEIFGVAFLLALLLLGITALARQGMLALAAFLGCLIVEYTWFNGWFRAGEHGAALAGFAIFAALFLGFPFVMRRRILDIQMPWAVAALSLPLHFILLRGGIDAVWPNDIPGVLAMLFALPLVAGLILLLRWIPADAPFRLNRLAWFAGAALFFVTLVFPLQFQKHWITIGWALEGAALLWLFHRLPHPGLRLTGIALLVAVFIRLTFNPAIFDYAPRGEHPILNWILYTYGIAAAACFAGMRLLAPRRERVLHIDARALVGAMGTILAFLLMNLEIADYFAPAGAALHLSFSGNLPRDMSYTIAWSLFALALLVIGISRGIRAARYAAIALLGVALLKLFIHDLARLDQLYRVAAFIAVAVIAFAASFLFQRFLRGTDKVQR